MVTTLAPIILLWTQIATYRPDRDVPLFFFFWEGGWATSKKTLLHSNGMYLSFHFMWNMCAKFHVLKSIVIHPSFSCSLYHSHWLNGNNVTLLKFQCIPIRIHLHQIHWGECDQWPGKACDQNVTKAGGMMFWSSLLGDSRKLVASSLKVPETQWNSLRLKPGAFYFLFKKWSQKTFKEERFPKCVESKSVLCFLLRCICRTFAVFRRNKIVACCC